MSDLESQIGGALAKLEEEIGAVREKLQPLLGADIDTLSAAEPANRRAVPYAVSAYALSSMLFAYLRSEGKDIAVIMPELERVKGKMEQVNKQVNKGTQSEAIAGSERADRQSPEAKPEAKPAGKHTKFDEKPVRVKKNKKTIAKVKKEREDRKRKT